MSSRSTWLQPCFWVALVLPIVAQQQRDLRIESQTVHTTPPAPSIPRSYALVIGIAKYANPKILELRYTERDAASIYSILISPEGGNFPAQNVHTLIGAKATLANIKHELEEWLPSVTKADDRVLVYFAGHGLIATDRKAYLAPYNIDPNSVADTGYLMDSLGDAFANKIQGKWKVLLTDACHSGALRVDEDAQSINHKLLDLNKSVFSMTASRDRESSYEGPDWGGGHGLFTYYVVQALAGMADENRDGIVTADELADYVRTHVRKDALALDPPKQQNPTAEGGSFDPNMLLAYVPWNVQPDAPPPPTTGTLVFESKMDGVEVFVDDKSWGVIPQGKPLPVPGLMPGAHRIKGVRLGYEPDIHDEMVYPGQVTTVTIRTMIRRQRSKAATDHLDKGIQFYSKGGAPNYQKAVEEFQRALAADPSFSQAALYLARAYNALFQEEQASKNFQRAIETDPDYLDARASFGGMLLDTGSYQQAVQQLTIVIQRDPGNAMAWYLLSQAFCRLESYPQAIEAGQKAIQLTPANAEAHFWLADARRMNHQWQPAQAEYSAYLRLSNFDSGAGGNLNYYVLGSLIGFGKKKRASQHDIWQDMRASAYFGLCNCERVMKQYDAAIADCQRSLRFDPNDPLTHYGLALAYLAKATTTNDAALAAAAREHFDKTIQINPQLDEVKPSRHYIEEIDKVLQAGH